MNGGKTDGKETTEAKNEPGKSVKTIVVQFEKHAYSLSGVELDEKTNTSLIFLS